MFVKVTRKRFFVKMRLVSVLLLLLLLNRYVYICVLLNEKPCLNMSSTYTLKIYTVYTKHDVYTYLLYKSVISFDNQQDNTL